MTRQEFEAILDRCCEILTKEAVIKDSFTSHVKFENKAREVLAKLISDYMKKEIKFDSSAQAFPDIAMGEFGVEVKHTKSDSWRTIANSILETQRVEGVKYIYIVYGKMGGTPEVKWADYASSIVHVRTSHVPRFEVEIADDNAEPRKSLFDLMGVSYDVFRELDMQDKMKYVRTYAKKIHPDGKLWWIEGEEEHTLPPQVRLYTNLSTDEKTRFRAEAALVCPGIVKPRYARNKYDDAVLFLITYHGVLCHQARDLFSAGSVANPKNDDQGGLYIERALKLIEKDMRQAALEMDDAIFVEYWGESVRPEDRIQRWLEKADAAAKVWKPSDSLFL